MSKKGVGLGVSDMVEGTGLLNDAVVKWTECEFVEWDYNGKSPNPVAAFRVAMEDEDGEEHEQYFSCGSAEDWEPSDDGKELVPIGRASGINKGCNFAILIGSLIEAGFPEDKIGNNCSVFEGMVARMVRVPAPKRSGLIRAPRADGKEYEPTNLVVDTIEKLPWEGGKGKKGSGKSGGKGKTTKKDVTPDVEEDEIDDLATETVMEVLEENPKGLDKKKLSAAVFKALKGNANRNAVVQKVYDDDFLNDGPWTYEKGVVKN